MLDEFNEFLEPRVSPERRMVLLEATRTLDSVLGAKTWITIDNLITDNSIDQLGIFDEIDECIIGLYYAVFLQFGITIDIEAVDATRHLTLSNALEALTQLELNEDRETILSALDFAADSEEALMLCLDTVSPGTGTAFIELVTSTKPALLKRIREVFSTPEALSESSIEEAVAYSKRLQEYRKNHEVPAAVEYWLDNGANLRMSPLLTIDLVQKYLLEERYDPSDEEFAEIIASLVLYSDTQPKDFVPVAKELCGKAFADEAKAVAVEQLLNSKLGGYGG